MTGQEHYDSQTPPRYEDHSAECECHECELQRSDAEWEELGETDLIAADELETPNQDVRK